MGEEVCNVLMSLNTCGAGYDHIHPAKVEHGAGFISLVLAPIINMLFQNGVFADALERGKIVPVYKKGDR